MSSIHKKNLSYIFIILLSGLIFNTGCKTSKPSSTASTEVVQLDTIVVSGKQTPEVYNPSETRFNDILHTRLDVKFDWAKRYLFGKANITIKPYFYPVKELKLDARGMDILEIQMVKGEQKTKLEYNYDKQTLTIALDKEYNRNETYEIFIDYVSKPDELTLGGSEAINADKGLYFINPDGTEKNKPKQIWTQGETQSNSAWFPTIDRPNERMTQEIYITVDKNFLTLSNGNLITQFENADGTRTDYWKQTLASAPYLTMMTIGEFAVVKDKSWKGKTVDYYVEPKYEKHALKIFGNTPEMLDFYSDKLGVDYPWEKYSQVVVRDYVSGAMENTSATVHGEFVQRTERELLDNTNEAIIAHELFHQWFGDVVTCESWANLPLNESFATYGEYLWEEYKYGRDAGDYILQKELGAYLQESRNKQVNMIRFDYEDREDMFDSHSYAKGGRILHMLRKYVGDAAFFEALKLYLNLHKYKSVEIHELRLAFEEVTGEDLNWFFNQWFMASGHPEINISTAYNSTTKTTEITIEQKQKTDYTPLYKLPLLVDIYSGGNKATHKITVTNAKETFSLPTTVQPDLINVDAEKMLLAVKKEMKNKKELAFQFNNAPLYMDKYEALDALSADPSNDTVQEIIVAALSDKFWNIRNLAIKNIKEATKGSRKDQVYAKLFEMATKDDKSSVRSAALLALSKNYEGDDLIELYKTGLNDKSYAVVSQALSVLSDKKPKETMETAHSLENEDNAAILTTIANLYASHGTDADNKFFQSAFEKVGGFDKYAFTQAYAKYLLERSDETINAGLPALEDVARNAKIWWMRLSGVQGISAIASMYSEREDELASKLQELKKNNPDAGGYQELENQLEKTKAQKQKVTDLLNAIKKAETDKKLQKMYGN